MLDEELKGVSRYMTLLGFPLGIIALLGAFTFGYAVFLGEISLTSKRLLLGSLLMSVSTFLWYVGRIYPVVMYDDFTERRAFSFGALVGTGLSGVAVFYCVKWLWPLMING